MHQLFSLPLCLHLQPLSEGDFDTSLGLLLLLPLELDPIQLPLQVHLVAVHLALHLDAQPRADFLDLHKVVPRHHPGEMIEPEGPEGEVDQEDEDEHEELEAVLNLTHLA